MRSKTFAPIFAPRVDSPLCSLFARTLLTLMFWSSGLEKLWDFSATVAEMQHFNLTPAVPIAYAVILVQLVGSALVIQGRYMWLGSLLLGGFTLLTIPVAHDFWNMQGLQAFLERMWVMEHLSIVGGLLTVALLSRRVR